MRKIYKRKHNKLLIIISLFIITIIMITGYSVFNTNISLNTKGNLKDSVWNFDYISEVQTFTVPKTGKYKLEVWGASGGAGTYNQNYGSHAGFGGYSSGIITFNSQDIIYIFVGGQGEYATGNEAEKGGYNGGGNGYSNLLKGGWRSGGGGGMTHISSNNNPVLSDINTKWNPDGTFIIAGGGGGSDNFYDIDQNPNKSNLFGTDDGSGGNAGGYKGENGRNGTSGAYSLNTAGTQTSGYLQGLGESFICADESGCAETGGAGGGFYSGFITRAGGGGGGSGYIGNTQLTNKHMACYNCETSDEESTKTISVTCASETPTKDCAKIGNGYARITYLGK